MSTHARIYLELKQEDKGRTIKFDRNKLPYGKECDKCFKYEPKELTIPEDMNFISVYVHFDGYYNGVGKTLLKNFKDYDTILNLMCLGEISALESDYGLCGDNQYPKAVKAYNAMYGEERVVRFTKDYTPDELYNYVFTKENKWLSFHLLTSRKWVNLKGKVGKSND